MKQQLKEILNAGLESGMEIGMEFGEYYKKHGSFSTDAVKLYDNVIKLLNTDVKDIYKKFVDGVRGK